MGTGPATASAPGLTAKVCGGQQAKSPVRAKRRKTTCRNSPNSRRAPGLCDVAHRHLDRATLAAGVDEPQIRHHRQDDRVAVGLPLRSGADRAMRTSPRPGARARRKARSGRRPVDTTTRNGRGGARPRGAGAVSIAPQPVLIASVGTAHLDDLRPQGRTGAPRRRRRRRASRQPPGGLPGSRGRQGERRSRVAGPEVLPPSPPRARSAVTANAADLASSGGISCRRGRKRSVELRRVVAGGDVTPNAARGGRPDRNRRRRDDAQVPVRPSDRNRRPAGA